MKILFLADARSVHIRRWMKFFQEQGDEIHLDSLETPPVPSPGIIQIKPKSRINWLNYFLATSEVKRAIRRINPDIVNAHFVPNYGFLGARANFRPLAVSVWGSDILISAKKSALHRRRASYVLRKADLLTSDSQYLSNEMIALGADFSKIVAFPMCVERDIYPPPARKVSTGERITIVSTRKFEPVYNLELLIDAIPEVVRKNERVRFIIVGEGSQERILKQKIESEKCSAAVEFIGSLNRADLIALLQRSDIYVSTSLSDSTSVSLLEAMSCGLVPIVTDIPGNREWVQDQVNGYLTDTRQPSLLAQKILKVCENLKQLQPLVDRNQKLVEEKANYHSHLAQLREKFAKLMDKGSKSGGL